MGATLDERIKTQIAHAYNNAPAIKQWLDDAGLSPKDINRADDLAKIPVLSKDRLVEIHAANPPFGGFLAVDPKTLPRIYISPGPIYDPQPVDESAVEAGRNLMRACGFVPGDRTLNTFMYHLTPAGLLLDELLRSVDNTVIPSGPGNTDLQIKMIMDLQITGFVGTPSYLKTIYDKAGEMGIQPNAIPLQKALFTAEPYTPAQRQLFEGEWSLQTTSVYGTADLGFVAYEIPGVQGFCVTEHVHMQICDPKTGELLPPGETGEIVVTTFNRGYPLVRFGTGDLGALAPVSDAKCEGRQQLLGLFGRSGDAVKVRGMFLHPNQLKAALQYFPDIKKIQAIITRPENADVVTIRLELHEGKDGTGLPDKLKELAQNAIRLRIDHVEFVKPGEIDATARTVQDNRDWS